MAFKFINFSFDHCKISYIIIRSSLKSHSFIAIYSVDIMGGGVLIMGGGSSPIDPPAQYKPLKIFCHLCIRWFPNNTRTRSCAVNLKRIKIIFSVESSSHIYINLDILRLAVCLGVCLFVSNKRQKWLNRSGPIFLWDLT